MLPSDTSVASNSGGLLGTEGSGEYPAQPKHRPDHKHGNELPR